MHLTVFGATGMVGKRIVQQALNRGFTVTAFGRNVENLIDQDKRDEKLIAIKGYILDQKDIAKSLVNSDAVISCIYRFTSIPNYNHFLCPNRIVRCVGLANRGLFREGRVTRVLTKIYIPIFSPLLEVL